jgi:nucleoside-diphosphate-sugar epimerase
VIHCAARSGDWGRYHEYYEANVIGTRHVATCCRRHGIEKILFISTPSVYFTGADRFDVKEDEPLPARQATHYAKTKLIAESELCSLREQGHRVLVFRPRAVLGPHESTFLPRILRLADRGRLPLINGGRALVDITHVDNLVDVSRTALSADDSAWDDVYNISNGDPIRVHDWFRQCLSALGRPFRPRNLPEAVARTVATAMEIASRLPFGPREPALTRFAVGYMARSMTLSLDKARDKLGYVPGVTNAEGFERLARWHRSQHDSGQPATSFGPRT